MGRVLGLDLPESEEVEALAQEFRKTRLESSVVALLSSLLTEPTLMS